MKYLKILTTKYFLKNIALLIGIPFFIILVIFLSLNIYTRHNENIEVPNLKTLTIAEVEKKLKELELNYIIMDSTEYINSFPKKSVIEQIPRAHEYVKKYRKIYLTLNAAGYSNIIVPDVFNKTRRDAINYLKREGFIIGKLTYIPDLGRDILLKIKYKGQEVNSGDTLKKKSELDLILGKGLSSKRVSVPNLKNMTPVLAKKLLQSISLNIGEVIYDNTLDSIDSINVKIYKQYPSAKRNIKVQMGANIDIWVSTDSLKLYNNGTGK